MNPLREKCPFCKKKLFEVGFYIVETVERYYKPYWNRVLEWGDGEDSDPESLQIQCGDCGATLENFNMDKITVILKKKTEIAMARSIFRISGTLMEDRGVTEEAVLTEPSGVSGIRVALTPNWVTYEPIADENPEPPTIRREEDNF